MKKGDSLEDFVQYVYSRLLVLNDYKNILVSKKVKIKGKSNALNEFDVYYEFMHLNLTCKVVIECKDWKYPVDIGEVRDFAQKIDDVGGCQIVGVMVSKNGYQSGAKTFANSCGITLLTISDLPNIYEIVAGIIKKSFLPDENIVGDPFWTIMEVTNGKMTGNYLSLECELNTIRPTIPLFYSKYLAEKNLEYRLNKKDYCVRGISQYQLNSLLSFSQFGNPQFAVFYMPVIKNNDGNTYCVLLEADEIRKNYYRG